MRGTVVSTDVLHDWKISYACCRVMGLSFVRQLQRLLGVSPYVTNTKAIVLHRRMLYQFVSNLLLNNGYTPAKAQSSWNLQLLQEEETSDFFIMLSSISRVI